MKIGMDVRMIQHSGIGVRIYHVCKFLPRFLNSKIEIILFGNPDDIKKYPELRNYQVETYTAPIYSIAEMVGHKNMKSMDLLDIPHFNFPLPFLKKSIITIHDLIPYIMKEFFPSLSKRIYINSMLRSLKFAPKILSVSECTKFDLVKHFNIDDNLIHVSYNGLDKKTFFEPKKEETLNFKKKYNLPTSYFLFVGIAKPHKNLKIVLKAMKKLWSENHPDSLVIAGLHGNIPIELEQFSEFSSKIFILPKIEYKELPMLYKGSKALIFPSLYEGFGFPIVEAQGSGCPVLSSNISVMPEVIGDSGVYFDPNNEESLVKAIYSLEGNQENLIEKGFKNCSRFSWEKTVEEISKIYEGFDK
jgi:glycosyltransferase involved in cell wall biosynthesis